MNMSSRLPLTLAVCLGVLLGLGAATFRYAEGFSYFSNDPRACANCHVMRPYLDSWQKSSHHVRAACNDCHVPHAIVPKMATKAENGWRHSMMFTLQNYPEALRITPHNAGRLQHNCVGCHEELVSDIRETAGGTRIRGSGYPDGSPHSGDVSCVHCHADVGHGPRR
jgi:cytochrome c nitrite reductase small subunit